MYKQIPENKYEIHRNRNTLKFYCRKHSETQQYKLITVYVYHS